MVLNTKPKKETKSVDKKNFENKSEPLRLVQYQKEWIKKADIDALPKKLRGIYVLYHTMLENRNVVYVGMSTQGIKGRLRKHRKEKNEAWDECSVFVVWPNIRDAEIQELEGILRHIYRKDSNAQQLNAQGNYLKLRNTPKIEISAENRKQREDISDSQETANAGVIPDAVPKKRAVKKTVARKKLI